jgi:limonene 1,2-monooxygenase
MKTDWFELQEARLHMPSFTHPHIEMVVAAARSPIGSRAAGTFGLGMLQLTGTSPDATGALAASWAACTDEADRHRQVVDRRNWRLVLQVHVAETREQAFRNVEFGLERFVQYFRDVGTFQIVPEGVPASASYMVENHIALIGTPDDVVEQIGKLWTATGGFGSYLVLAHNWADWNATKRNYELLARYVIPKINSMNVSRQASYDYVKVNHSRFLEEATAAVQAETDRYARDKAAHLPERKS